MRMASQTGIIKELQPGVWWALLDHPVSLLLRDLVCPDVPYVLCWGHRVGQYQWEPFNLPVTVPAQPEPVQARVAEFDFLCSTEQFLTWLPAFRPGIRAVQLHKKPPDHLDMGKIQGKERWRILNDCGWHVLLDAPGNDFGEVASPHRDVVERAIVCSRAAG